MQGERSGRPVIGITVDLKDGFLTLRHQYPDAIIEARGMPLLVPSGNDPVAVAEYVDGLLIPGGDDIDPAYFSEAPHPSVRLTPKEKSDFEISLLTAIMKLGKPVFGICYGMQLINVALGGSLFQDIESHFGRSVDHKKGSHIVRCGCPWISGEYTVNTSHHQAVRELGRDLEACAVSSDGLVEGIYLRGYPFLLGVQWHPERAMDGLSSNLFRSFVESAYARQ